MTKIKPRGKRVLVRQDDPEDKVSAMGLIIPDNVEEDRKAVGTVIFVGEGIKDIKKGERVFYGAFAGERIKLREGKKGEADFVMLDDEDVLGFVEGK